MAQMSDTIREAIAALGVVTHTPAIRAHLTTSDPQALRQAEQAFDALRALRSAQSQSEAHSGVQSHASLDPRAYALDTSRGRSDALDAATLALREARRLTERADALMAVSIAATEDALRRGRALRQDACPHDAWEVVGMSRRCADCRTYLGGI